MNIYGSGARRSSQGQARAKSIVRGSRDIAMFKMAQRIAKIALPKRSYSWMKKVAANEFKQYGNFGMASASTEVMEMAFSEQFNQTASEASNAARQAAHSTLGSAFGGSARISPPEPVRNTIIDRTTANVDNAYRGPDQSTVIRANPRAEDDEHGHPGEKTMMGPGGEMHALPEELLQPDLMEADAGLGHPRGTASNLNKAPSLAQVLGSGLLTPQQIEAASFNNVYRMFTLDGYGASEGMKREMTFYMQRLVLEGFNHGLDIPRLIREKYRGAVPIHMKENPGYAGLGGGGYINFKTGSWNGLNDSGRLRLFFHEMGHELLVRSHTKPLYLANTSIMSYAEGGNKATHITNSWDNYIRYMNEFFWAWDKYGTLGSKEMASVRRNYTFQPGRQNTDVNAILNAHKDWFPSVTGAVPNTGGGGGYTGGGGGPTPQDDINLGGINIPINLPGINPNFNIPINFNPQIPISFTPNIPITFNTINPVAVDTKGGDLGAGQMQIDAGAGAAPASLESYKTPVLPPMPNMPNLGAFAAGLASLGRDNGGFASALMELKSG